MSPAVPAETLTQLGAASAPAPEAAPRQQQQQQQQRQAPPASGSGSGVPIDAEGVLAPWDAAGCFSRVCFSYVRPLLRVGWTKALEMEDLPRLGRIDQAARVVNVLEDAWSRRKLEAPLTKRALWSAIFHAHRRAFLMSAFYAVLESAFFISQPLMLRYLIHWLSSDQPFWVGAALAGGLALASLAQAVDHHLLYFTTMRLSMWLKHGFTGVVNNKLLRVSTSALVTESAGKVLNLVSTDVLRFEQGTIMIHFGWVGLLDFCVCLVLIAGLVGWAAATSGIAVLLVTIILQTKSGTFLAKIRKATAELTDTRLRLLTQVLSGILTVKAFAWELPFADRIADARAAEARSIFRSQFIKAANLAIAFAGPVLTSLVTFSVFWAMGGTLEAEIVYPTVGLLQVLRLALGKKFARFWETFPEMDVAVQRLQHFLTLPDAAAPSRQAPEDDSVLVLQEVNMRWPTGAAEQAPVVSGVNCSVRRGEMLAVIGPVGCGKSAFLQGLLGELVIEGSIRLTQQGGVAYAPQQPWIFAGTLRENIIFGSKFDAARYEAVVEACALSTDIEQLADGDATEIGDKGVNLSGGQKARVGLARAVYRQDTALVVVDDPLAAVDPHVAEHLLRRCLRSPLLSKVAVVLATHHRVAAETAEHVLALGTGGQAEPARPGSHLRDPRAAAQLVAEGGAAPAEAEAPAAPQAAAKEQLKLVLKEDRKQGSVTFGTYQSYASAGGLCLAVTVLVLLLVGQVAMIAADYWLKVWSDAGDQGNGWYAGVFAMLCGGTAIVGFSRAIFFFRHANRANTSIHDDALASIVRSPMSFFTANPLGRVLNRFSSDLGQVDEMLPVILFDCLQTATLVLGALVLVVVAFVYLLAAVPFLFAGFWWLRKYATASLRELKRLDGTSRSPYFAQFTANLNGLVTIRAFGQQQEASEAFVDLLGFNMRAWYWWLIANRWIGFRLDILCSGIMVACVSLALILRRDVDPGLFGLAVAYALSLSGMLQYMVRQSAQVETFMTCVERILHYAKRLPADGAGLPAEAPKGWPESGAVALSELSVRYREDLPVVLKEVTADIPSGSKVGIVGRTGSGKSSLVQALLGLNELCGGSLRIGGADVTQLPLRARREAIAYIPQEPTLFRGTVRHNLDPFDSHADSELWDALSSSQLKSVVSDLSDQVEEGGSNYSVGQRQLFSLARASLRGARIVIMDEATASVDHDTDKLIQEAIKASPCFRDATLLVIAHRLETVEHSDLLLVFDAGRLVEAGSPQELRGAGGLFASLVHSSALCP
eukprot:TRINITY_DN4697_c1_g2_i4.p1 TRINITY_DN4697_c1_g2~~TRINITY_DN4697_c1_g2_i4.p1  ORF type:complete len:1320 (+),score=449.60 TRINITY_DN4697_c1_g2_i4:128-3961(+)